MNKACHPIRVPCVLLFCLFTSLQPAYAAKSRVSLRCVMALVAVSAVASWVLREPVNRLYDEWQTARQRDRVSANASLPIQMLSRQANGGDGALKDLAEYWVKSVRKSEKQVRAMDGNSLSGFPANNINSQGSLDLVPGGVFAGSGIGFMGALRIMWEIRELNLGTGRQAPRELSDRALFDTLLYSSDPHLTALTQELLKSDLKSASVGADAEQSFGELVSRIRYLSRLGEDLLTGEDILNVARETTLDMTETKLSLDVPRTVSVTPRSHRFFSTDTLKRALAVRLLKSEGRTRAVAYVKAHSKRREAYEKLLQGINISRLSDLERLYNFSEDLDDALADFLEKKYEGGAKPSLENVLDAFLRDINGRP